MNRDVVLKFENWEQVLIDTWWNVNHAKAYCYSDDELVLIDTWWNVNKAYEHEYMGIPGFNRYMVECEF